MNKIILPRLVRLFILASAASTLALTSGCVFAAIGAGAATVVYVQGDLEDTLSAGLEKTVRAANVAVKDLAFVKVSENKDALLVTIVARNADDKKIQIKLESVSANVTKVNIRVGTFGDEALSLAIMDKIKANL